ncbi:hypothetical protein V1478_016190 [Vespula squamosa]|uniref:Uncharacterized protein n=1 Tax=Vespula squamosa TaxID=30214 RepID=A0ABD1ZZ73_VESSQ
MVYYRTRRPYYKFRANFTYMLANTIRMRLLPLLLLHHFHYLLLNLLIVSYLLPSSMPHSFSLLPGLLRRSTTTTTTITTTTTTTTTMYSRFHPSQKIYVYGLSIFGPEIFTEAPPATWSLTHPKERPFRSKEKALLIPLNFGFL